jgi:hypothetical protein
VGKLRRTSRLIRVSWEHQAHISADLGSGVNPLRGFLDAEESTGIGARDDQEIPVDPVSLAAGILDLLDVFLDRNHMRNVFVVVRPLRKDLVLDMHAGDARFAELPHGPHRVQRIAPARAGVCDRGRSMASATALASATCSVMVSSGSEIASAAPVT